MNILIFNWRDIYHPMAGGAEISLFEHAKYWRKKGARVTLFASGFTNAKEEEEIDGIKVVRHGSHYTSHFWGWYYFIRGKLGKPDIVVDCFHFLPFFTPLYIRRAKIIALINEPGKNAWFKNIVFPFSLIGYLIEPLFFVPYRKLPFITSSASIAKELLQYKLNKNQINIIHHGLSIQNPAGRIVREENPVVVYLAQISPDKGIEDAVKAFAMVKNKFPKAHLWVIGKAKTGKYMKMITKCVKNLNLDNAVRFFGYVDENEKFRLLSRSWVLVHASIREGWGLNVIEANAMGKPAVGYNVVGLRDSIQDNKTGLLTEMNYESLAAGIIKLITDKNLFTRLSINAKEYARQFSWEESAKKSYELIESIYENEK